MIIINAEKIREEVNKEIEKIERENIRLIDAEELTKKIIDAVLNIFEPEEQE